MIETDNQAPTLGRLARRTVSTCIGALEIAPSFSLWSSRKRTTVMKLVMFGVGGAVPRNDDSPAGDRNIIFLMPEAYRVYAAFGFAVLYLAGAAGAGLAVKNLLKQAPFAESLRQIKKDAELLDAFK